MLKINYVTAAEIKTGDRIMDPSVIKPYLTKDGLLPNELADAFNTVLKVGILKDIDINKRNEILKNFCYSLDTIIIMVKLTGVVPKEFKQFVPKGTMNEFHSPSDIIIVLAEDN